MLFRSLFEAATEFGRTARTPALWVYAENDKSFPPTLTRQMFADYQKSGGAGEFFLTPPSGDDGHYIMASAPVTLWWPKVSSFLAAQGLPSEEIIKVPTVEMAPPAELSKKGKESFERYRASRSYEKAFASDGHQGWGWGSSYRTQQEAVQAALALCGLNSSRCSVYAVGDRLMPTAP